MPISRSPPPAAASPCCSTESASLAIPRLQLQHSSSEPSLTNEKGTTFRKHKRFDSDNERLQFYMSNMTKMFQEFKEAQEKNAEKMCAAAEDMRKTVDFMAQKYDELKGQYELLQNERKEEKNYIKSLEDKIELLERNSRATCLEIRNVPMCPNETKSSLLETVISVGKALNLQIQPLEVKDIFRINSKDPNAKTIIVDLTSSLLKEKIIGNYRKFNKTYKSLTTEHLKIKGPARPVFISENLTAKMKRLFFHAREFAKANDFRFCWVSHGKIFLRKREKGSLVRVADDADLDPNKSRKQQQQIEPAQPH